MAESRRYGLTPQLDIKQILEEAQSRWLRPAEICEILRNYTKFVIAPEPPNKPPSGALFLFDRKVLRYFRKDGHNWRKKKDGKTVKEAHERLKAGSVDVLHCYYAHGEENENFQRRSYWMLEEDLMHIVLVHYREVTSGRSSASRSRNVEDMAQVSSMNSPDCSNSNSIANQSQLISQVTDAESPNSAHTSEYEDAESDNYQRSSRYNPNIEMQQYDDGFLMDAHLANRYVPVLDNQYVFQELQAEVPKSDFFPVVQGDVTKVFDETGLELSFNGSKTQLDLTPWEEILENSTTGGFQAPIFQSSVSYTQSVTSDIALQADPFLYESVYPYDSSSRQANITTAHSDPAWQISNDSTEPVITSNVSIGNDPLAGAYNSEAPLKQQSLDLPGAEGLKKYDSFSRWMSKELEEVDHSHITTSSGAYWSEIGNGVIEDPSMSSHDHLDTYVMSPSLSQDQLFSIIDFSPCWAFSLLETKVLVTGTFLTNKENVEKCKWSCMFGEVEVPAEVIGDGTLRCIAPALKSGRVPFYITCSNRQACSEVREFEYRENDSQYMETSDSQYNNLNEMLLHIRLDKLLSLGPDDHLKQNSDKLKEKVHLFNKINSVMNEEDNWSILVNRTQEESLSPDNAEDKLLEALLREKLHTWLLQKVAEDGKGPSMWDEEGQGVLHLAAALGYHWAIRPTITAGVNINFRDVHGWTALHWAASCGRELTVVTLITMGAAPGLLTDPTPEHPSGRTPADLASANGHKGIAGFLAESSLTSHLETLTLKDSKGSDVADFSTLGRFEVKEQGILQVADEDSPAGLSLKDSLSAVRNASQAAARIYQVFRVHSFHRKKLVECENDKSGMSDERALSLLSVKSLRTGQHDMPLHAAAIRIQNKFRGWKGRKDFLIIRQRIVKIQAHVRGHQVRKHLRKIVWSVGIVEKAILRWRRKGCGLRGFRPEGLSEGPKLQNQPAKEDDYDFLQEGRKQTEARLQKALDRVKSMVQYPEARDQYRRLLTVVTELQESKAMQENSMNVHEAGDGDVMIELEELYADDTFMPNALH